MPIATRRGTEADAGAAAELWLGSRRAAREVIPAPVHSDEEVRGWFRSHVVAECELWIAEDASGVPAGILVLEDDWVDQLYVDPASTGRGIGTGLLEVAKGERPGGLRLWCFQANTGARRFYERHGFVQAGRTDGRANEERAPDVLYVWAGAPPTA